ncbi:MAG TPA: 3-phosphoglycerate dehydrogenase [Verrucomicrobiales bacterium]|nr:MAG: 3-phosphoglycerate dehydrogenase [Verrucomicrobiae bacterium Tous-C3TDCM]PAZ06193.1 MAG: 3-phosphoglycerate dehydrogenase [Verrucomicrobiae bacterium AMD-G2]HBE23102.1 3-phosphoglycerate dehydrogenase [Verrucomicrobiales bacterium]
MSSRVLVTTCSFQDTPGPHHQLLESQGFEIVRERGPLSETKMLELAGEFDAFLCGDDAITRAVLEKSGPRLKVISKYGIGLDKIDLGTTKEMKIPVMFTPGVNHTTVAEHTFCLLLALVKNLIPSVDATRKGEWLRLTGHELWSKKIGVIGLGRIGQEVIIRAKAFGMEVHGYGNFWPTEFCEQYGVIRHESIDSIFSTCDIISPHTKLAADTKHLINRERLALLPQGAVIVNTGRGELADAAAIMEALDSGHLAGYATDVMEQEPPATDDPLLRHPKAIVTAHVGSRTYESVPRQALMSLNNLVNFLNNSGPVFCANGVVSSAE